ncbi:MAG: VCBS repeat-containing protein [Planctomycetes bacterium]|nr:VCBS repeat-containing protein [Planctomycetota bacterium]
MRTWFRLTLPLSLAAAIPLVLVGCETMLGTPEDNVPGQPVTDTTTTLNSSVVDGGGFFTELDGDILEVRPEEIELDEEGEATASNFRAVQVDPVSEDTAGPKFIKPYDIDNDGLVDLVSAWNESQPVQIHLQRRDLDGGIRFITVNLGGTGPISLIAGVEMADFDRDGWLDVAILVKATGGPGICPKPGQDPPFELLDDEGEIQILFNPGNLEQITDGDAWREVRLDRSRLGGRREVSLAESRVFPEFNGYTAIAVGEIDGINGPDIVVAYNPITCEFLGDDPPINRILFFPNPGGPNSRDPGTIPLTATADAGPDQGVRIPDPDATDPQGAEVILDGSGSYSSLYSGVGYFWEQVAGPPVGLAGVSTAAPVFTAPITAAAMTFRLTVSAGESTDFDYVTVIAGDPGNQPPVVTASGEQTLFADVDEPAATPVEMFAFATDPDGDTLTFLWTQVYGEPVALNGPATASPTFIPPETGGELRFRVTVSDGTLFDSAQAVVITGSWAPLVLDVALARSGDLKIMDIDLDNDNDLVYTWPSQVTQNVTWSRNPTVPHDETSPSGPQASHLAANWEYRPIGHVDTEAEVLAIGDIDLDGFDDIMVRSSEGRVVQWFRHPGAADLEPIFPPSDPLPDRFNFPWQVYTMAEFDFRHPYGIAIGDLTGDGFNETVIAAGGVVYWYDASLVDSPYDPWGESFVIDDTKANRATDDPDDPDFLDVGTIIYGLTVVDIDGDGFGDVVGTLDRRTFSGLTDDTLIWFRNTLGDRAE